MKKIIFFFISLLCLINAQAQSFTGAVKGVIKDENSKVPIEFCPVVLISASDSSIVNGAFTDETGFFEIQNIKEGSYFIKIENLGYTKKVIPIQILDKNIDLSLITIAEETTKVDEVVVIGQKPDVVIDIDKKVYDTEKNITATGGTAVDVLKNIPSVSIDSDGNINLRGSSQVLLYIDGKPSVVSQDNAQNILNQIPASNIENIEIITNPSARYEAQGMAGIINIKLKKNKKEELFNGNASVGIGSRDKYNASLNLNFKKNKWNISTGYSYRYNPLFTKMTNHRENNTIDTAYTIDQSSYGNLKLASHTARLAVDYDWNKYNVTSVSGLYSSSISPFPEDYTYTFTTPTSIPIFDAKRTNYSNTDAANLEANVAHRKTFDKLGKEIYVGTSISNLKNDIMGDYRLVNSYPNGVDSTFTQALNQQSTTRLITGQVDYMNRFTDSLKYETGLKFVERNFDNDYALGLIPAMNGVSVIKDVYTYNDQVMSAYAQLYHQLGKLSYQVGLRAENTSLKSNSSNANFVYASNYFNLFPSFSTLYKLNTQNDIQFSFSNRINRPRTAQVNPYLDWAEYPVNVRMGNPSLKPEIVYNFELAHLWTKERNTFTSTIYYRNINNTIQYYRVLDNNGYGNLTFKNFTTSSQVGIEFLSKYYATPWLDFTTTVNLLQSSIKGDADAGLPSRNTFTWNVKLANSIRLPFNMAFQLIASYNAPSILAQGTIKEIYGVDVALKKDFLKNKRLTASLNVQDLFNTREMNIEASGTSFSQRTYRKRESQIVMFVLLYKFGSGDMGKKKPTKSEGDMNQGGDGGF
jgi:iron complex outermembrane receptor protein